MHLYYWCVVLSVWKAQSLVMVFYDIPTSDFLRGTLPYPQSKFSCGTQSHRTSNTLNDQNVHINQSHSSPASFPEWSIQASSPLNKHRSISLQQFLWVMHIYRICNPHLRQDGLQAHADKFPRAVLLSPFSIHLRFNYSGNYAAAAPYPSISLTEAWSATKLVSLGHPTNRPQHEAEQSLSLFPSRSSPRQRFVLRGQSHNKHPGYPQVNSLTPTHWPSHDTGINVSSSYQHLPSLAYAIIPRGVTRQQLLFAHPISFISSPTYTFSGDTYDTSRWPQVIGYVAPARSKHDILSPLRIELFWLSGSSYTFIQDRSKSLCSRFHKARILHFNQIRDTNTRAQSTTLQWVNYCDLTITFHLCKGQSPISASFPKLSLG